MIELLSKQLQEIVENTGEKALFVVGVILALDYFRVFELTKMDIPYLNIVLWAYLLLNIGLANIFKFIRRKNNPNCPKCNRKLNEEKEYSCSKCGKLRFGGK